jgi:hypothetical protein
MVKDCKICIVGWVLLAVGLALMGSAAWDMYRDARKGA